MRRSPFPPGWARYRSTWCRSQNGRHAEVSRSLNGETRLIEWHALAWKDSRAEPLLDEFTGQELGDALELAQEALA